jgi:glycosyltransferase involved in cell wall biosynthesis
VSRSLDILWVKSGPLHPLNTGGRKRTHAMLTGISRQHHVTFLSFQSDVSRISHQEVSDPYAAEKIWIPYRDPSASKPALFAALARNAITSSLPYSLEKWLVPSMKEAIVNFDSQRRPDLIVCDFLYPAPNFEKLRLSAPTILFQHNMEAQIWERLATNKVNPLARAYFRSQANRMAKAERSLSRLFEAVITVSPEDTAYACEHYPDSRTIGSVPTGVDTDYFAPDPQSAYQSKQLGFLGSMDWMPNIEAVTYFMAEIFPTIVSSAPECQFHIIGRNPGRSILQLSEADSNVSVSGTVDDVRPLMAECAALVVPLKSGGGTRIKILEAMSLGVPVISTSIGAEGLGLAPGCDILIADSPGEFAAACLRIMADRDLRARLSSQSRARVVADHRWDIVTRAFLDLCATVLPPTAAP